MRIGQRAKICAADILAAVQPSDYREPLPKGHPSCRRQRIEKRRGEYFPRKEDLAQYL